MVLLLFMCIILYCLVPYLSTSSFIFAAKKGEMFVFLSPRTKGEFVVLCSLCWCPCWQKKKDVTWRYHFLVVIDTLIHFSLWHILEWIHFSLWHISKWIVIHFNSWHIEVLSWHMVYFSGHEILMLIDMALTYSF